MSNRIAAYPGEESRGAGAGVRALLPGQQSKAERLAHGKNRVLQCRLQSCLHDMARDRRSWLLGLHIQGSKFRRRLADLDSRSSLSRHAPQPANDHLASTVAPPKTASTTEATTAATTTETSASQFPPRVRRPATCVGTGRRPTRAATLDKGSNPRPQTVVRWEDGSVVRPLFKVRANRITTASFSTDGTDTDSSDGGSLSDSSDGPRDGRSILHASHVAVRRQNASLLGLRGRHHGHGADSKTSRPGSTERPTTARSRSSTLTRTWDDPGPSRPSPGRPSRHRPMTTLGRMSGPLPPDTTTPGLRRRAVTARVGGRGPGCGRGGRLSQEDYLQFVLDLERDRYQASQMKVRTYLQNLRL